MVSWLRRLGRWIGGLVGLATVRGPFKTTDPGLAALFAGGTTSTSGAQVTQESALSLSAVFAAVTLYGRIVASLPLHVYRQRADGRKEVASDLRVYRLLHTAPNPEMTAVTFRRVLDWHRLLGGCAYAEIVWDDDGEPLALWPIETWRVKPERDEEGTLFYRIDGLHRLETADVLAIPLVSQDGVTGQSFLDFAIESLGLGITSQEFAGAYFANGARPGGYLHNPQSNLEQKARDQMRAAWEKRHGGAKSQNLLGLTWGSWTYNSLPQESPINAQLLESRKFQTEEVSRWTGIPPHLLADLSRATFSNIDSQQLSFLTYSLGPVLVDYEQEYDRKLLIPPSVFAKHRVEGFLRADTAARAEFYVKLAGIGALTINEILELEDRDPIGPLGDKRYVPANWQTLENAAKMAAPGAPPLVPPEPKPGG